MWPFHKKDKHSQYTEEEKKVLERASKIKGWISMPSLTNEKVQNKDL